MNFRHFLNYSLGIFVCLLLFIGLNINNLLSNTYLNLGLLKFTKTVLNQTDDFEANIYPERISGNGSDDKKFKSLIEKAYELCPDSEKNQIHLSTYYFINGLRSKATQFLKPIESYPLGRTFMVIPNRYEYQLTLAKQLELQGDFKNAIKAYRLGLAFGLGKTLPIDNENYFNTLARYHLHATGVVDKHTELHHLLLAGKYFLLSNKLDDAKSVLFRVLNDSQFENLSNEDRSDTFLLLGNLFEDYEDTEIALNYYQHAMQTNPDSRNPYLRSMFLLQEDNSTNRINIIKDQIGLQGPEYIIGKQWQTKQVPLSNNLETGVKLIGYDLDRKIMAVSLNFDIYLWWELPGNQNKSGKDWVEVGKYWVQRQTVTNFFPNSSFDWGVGQDGIPNGLDHYLYGVSSDNIYVKDINWITDDSKVLVADNNNLVQDIAIASRKFNVDPDSYYLMAGWLWDEGGTANIGRNCWWENDGGPYYIAYQREEPYRPNGIWVHIANIEKPFPGQRPDTCEILLINYQSQTKAYWDDILFVKIDVLD